MSGTTGLVVNDLMSADLVGRLGAHGVPETVALRLFARVHARGADPALEATEVPGLSRAGRDALAAAGARLGRLRVVERRESRRDGFCKYLFELDDGALIEAVRIPLPAGPKAAAERHVVCVSSQVGCALDCAFCATGAMGLRRNLRAWEMVEQVARIRAEADAPVRGVVFMGMGEPLLNYDSVVRAAEILADPAGPAIARKAMTISTAGIVPGIQRFTAERRKHRLAVSLTSAIPEKRARLMPIAARYPLDEVLAAAQAYTEASGERVVIAYVMIAGENVGREDATALVEVLRGLRVRLNLIDVNDATGRYSPPADADLARFRDWLAPLGQPVVRRYSGGKEIAAACGMLAAGRTGATADAAPSP